MYYYTDSDQENTNGSANTDTLLDRIAAVAGLRLQVRKLQLGVFAAPTDNNVRIQLRRTSTLIQTTGTTITPQPNQVDAPAATGKFSSLPTQGTGVLTAVAQVQLAYNMRGTAMWAAFIEDETMSLLGATAPNAEMAIDSQASVASVPVTIFMQHSE